VKFGAAKLPNAWNEFTRFRNRLRRSGSIY
jgi:hypothetical protein